MEEEKKEEQEEEKKNYLKDILTFALIIIGVLLVKKYIVTPVQVSGDSMYSTLKDGDIMILNKVSYKIHGIKRFDVVVINSGGSLIIKRVIGLPNEIIRIKDNKLYINDVEIEQDFLPEGETTADYKYETGDNCYFVMGDNRDISKDSRELGCFDISKIEGTTSFTIFPFNRIGFKN